MTVDGINSGIGLQGLSVVSASNANVVVPSFPIGIVNPVTAGFTVPNPAQPVDFTLRATSRSRAVRNTGSVLCGTVIYTNKNSGLLSRGPLFLLLSIMRFLLLSIILRS